MRTDETKKFRVAYGWGAYQDFSSRDEAEACYAEKLAEPIRDPHLRRVTMFDLAERNEHGTYLRIKWDRSPRE